VKLPLSQIELATSPEPSRYTLQAVKLDVENKRIMATDGHILAIVPCEVSPEDHSALISTEAIKQLRAMQKRAKSVPVEVRTNGKVTATGVGETAEFDLATGQFPNVDMVVPKFDGPATISFDVELLMRLAKAMHTKDKSSPQFVSLYIKDTQSPILVKSHGNKEAVGVLMPCRTQT
jgi:DNA polymerase III sliding clamp (beta) subunit (PCNA family)